MRFFHKTYDSGFIVEYYYPRRDNDNPKRNHIKCNIEAKRIQKPVFDGKIAAQTITEPNGKQNPAVDEIDPIINDPKNF